MKGCSEPVRQTDIMILLELPYRLYVTVINCIAAVTSKIPEKSRHRMITAAVFLLSVYGMVPNSNARIKDLLQFSRTAIPFSMLLLILILAASIDRKIDRRQPSGLRPLFWIGWYLCFIVMFVSSRMHQVRAGYNMWSIAALTVFPMLMIVWNRRGELPYFCSVIARSMVGASYAFLAVNLILVPFITNNSDAENMAPGYLGIMANPNGNGLVVLPFFTAALYLIITERKGRPLYLASAAISVMFAVISITRTAELAIIIETVAAVLITLRHRGILRSRPDVKMLLCAAACIAIAAAAGMVLLRLDEMDINAYALTEYDEAAAEVQAHPALIRLNDMASGRIILWKAYIKACGMAGHGSPDGLLFEGHTDSQWAHNNALDIWYASGFPAFAGYLIWLTAAWVWILYRCIVKKGFRKEYLLVILAFTGYFTEAMLEITIYPMYTGIAFMAYALMTPFAFRETAARKSIDTTR